jgi:hypothetical protein
MKEKNFEPKKAESKSIGDYYRRWGDIDLKRRELRSPRAAIWTRNQALRPSATDVPQ